MASEEDDNSRNNEQPQIMGAIEYPAESCPNQPSQPHNLQGLLRYSIEASTGQHNGDSNSQFVPAPLDEERRRFLEETLSSMTINVIEILSQAIEMLNQAGTLDAEDDPIACEEALEEITDHIDNMDTANDFHKIGGFRVFGPCFNSVHSGVRWRAADLLAELTQNNPYCQEKVLEERGLLPALLSLLDTDRSEQVRVKALHAVSCLVREYEAALAEFRRLDGFSVLLRSMQGGVQKLQIKASFLLSNLCHRHVKDELNSMGFVEQLAGLIGAQDLGPATEFLLLALVTLATDHPPSQAECRKPSLGLRATLRRLLGEAGLDEEYAEVSGRSQVLLEMLFSDKVEEDR